MKKSIILVALLISGLFVAAIPAQADDVLDVSQMVGNLEGLAAEVNRGFLCGVGPGGVTTDSHATLSNSGHEILSCHCTACTDAPAQVIRGLLCGTFYGGLTTDSQLVVSDTGDVNLRCKTTKP